ncbi:MAG: ATP-binding cassette domain-containing protein, partial [Oscillospiraceae bacterium]|nr:ATP-binding cassette domain-containing protein [Oscillospiraceae bacterium]
MQLMAKKATNQDPDKAAGPATPGRAPGSSQPPAAADRYMSQGSQPAARARTQVTAGLKPAAEQPDLQPMFEVQDLNLYYGKFQALRHINLTIPAHQVTAFIGPSGCGKSTLLRCFNRMNDLLEDVRMEGRILLDGRDLRG